MTLLNSVQNISVKPFQNAIETLAPLGDVSCGQSIKARALFLIQAIISLVALPIILLLGTISLTVRTCQGKGKVAANELWDSLKMQVAVVIPTSLVGPFIPASATLDVFTSLLSCTFPIIDEYEESLNSRFDFPGVPPGGPGHDNRFDEDEEEMPTGASYLPGRQVTLDSRGTTQRPIGEGRRRFFAMHPEFIEAARAMEAERNLLQSHSDFEAEEEEMPTGPSYMLIPAHPLQSLED